MSLAKIEERRGEPLRGLGSHAVVRPGLRERLPGQLRGQWLVSAEPVQPRERREHLCAGAPGGTAARTASSSSIARPGSPASKQ